MIYLLHLYSSCTKNQMKFNSLEYAAIAYTCTAVQFSGREVWQINDT